MKKKRDIEVFSLSFLDCICCGFGAIILLFVLTIGPIKKQTKESEKAITVVLEELQNILLQKQSRQLSIKAEIEEIVSSTPGSQNLKDARDRLISLEQKIKEAQQALAAVSAKASALEEQEVAQAEYQVDVTTSPVGVPTDKEHLVFIIDTSGSMRTITGVINPLVLAQISRTLNAYPQVKSLQVMDCSGNYLIGGTRGQWIPDTPQNRNRIIQELNLYQQTSASNPIPGLVQFFRDFKPQRNPNQSIGVYIFGDEFTDTASAVLKKIDELNPRNPVSGKRVVSINAVGFPFRLRPEPRSNETGYKFAHLMRELTREHDGAFMVAGKR